MYHVLRLALKGVYVSLSDDSALLEEVNDLFHPMGGPYNKDMELSFEMQINANKYPGYPMQSASAQFYQLRKSLSIHTVNSQMDISATEYRSTKFVIGVATEKILGASFSGYNSKASDLTVFRLKPANGAAIVIPANYKIHDVLHYDNIRDIRDGGFEVLE